VGRILLIVTGTAGDVAPMVAVTSGLAGSHSVTVLTHSEYFGPFARVGGQQDAGALPFRPSEIFASPSGQASMEGGWLGARRLGGLYGLVRRYAPALIRAFYRGIAGRSYDVVLTAGPTPGVERIALACEVPVRRVQYQPTWPSPDTRSLYISRPQPRSRASIRLGNSLIERGAPGFFRFALRGTALPDVLYPELDESARLGLPTLFAFPERLGTQATRQPPARHVGFIAPLEGHFSSCHQDEASVLERIAVRATKQRAIYVGFGSMRTAQAARQVALLARAATARGYFVVIQAPTGALAGLSKHESQSCVAIGPIDHDRLFPIVDIVMCHGGINTCAAALRAAKPLVILPQWLDQFYWGSVLQACRLAVSGPRQLHTVSDAVDILKRTESFDFAVPAKELRSRAGARNVVHSVEALMEREGALR
jgi:UDP:flavonoid glycosyltransferase YjiC (YdhE family)